MISYLVLFNICFCIICSIFFYKRLSRKINRKIKSISPLLKKNTTYEEIANYVKENNTGRHSYFCDYVSASCKETTIGKFCSIADNVSLGTTFHPIDRLSTHPFTYFKASSLTVKAKQEDFVFKKPIIIGNDVWIGKHVTIMDGITVGDGAIIGTNAVVTKDVPPYAIVVGVPARILRYRFDEDTVKDLLRLKWWDLDDEVIAELPVCDVSACIEKLKEIRGEK